MTTNVNYKSMNIDNEFDISNRIAEFFKSV